MSIKFHIIQEARHKFKYYTNESHYYFTFPFPQRVCWAMEPETRLAAATLVAFLMTCHSSAANQKAGPVGPHIRHISTTISPFRLQVFLKTFSLPWAKSWVASLPLDLSFLIRELLHRGTSHLSSHLDRCRTEEGEGSVFSSVFSLRLLSPNPRKQANKKR